MGGASYVGKTVVLETISDNMLVLTSLRVGNSS